VRRAAAARDGAQASYASATIPSCRSATTTARWSGRPGRPSGRPTGARCPGTRAPAEGVYGGRRRQWNFENGRKAWEGRRGIAWRRRPQLDRRRWRRAACAPPRPRAPSSCSSEVSSRCGVGGVAFSSSHAFILNQTVRLEPKRKTPRTRSDASELEVAGMKLWSRGGGGPGRHSNTLEEGLTGHRFDNFPLESHVVTFAPASTVHHRFNGSQPIKHKVSVFYLGKQSSRPAPTDGLPPRRVPMGLARAGLARRLADLGGACPHQLSSTAAPP
jgi:hypothetical protein